MNSLISLPAKPGKRTRAHFRRDDLERAVEKGRGHVLDLAVLGQVHRLVDLSDARGIPFFYLF